MVKSLQRLIFRNGGSTSIVRTVIYQRDKFVQCYEASSFCYMYLASKVARCNISSNTKETNMHAIASQWLTDHHVDISLLLCPAHTSTGFYVLYLWWVYVSSTSPSNLILITLLQFLCHRDAHLDFGETAQNDPMVKRLQTSFQLLLHVSCVQGCSLQHFIKYKGD